MDPEDAKDKKDEEDDGDKFFSFLPEGSPVIPQQQKQMPASPPSYSKEGAVGGLPMDEPPECEQGEYLKRKELEALKEKRVVEELGLPLASEPSEQTLEKYNAMVKALDLRKRSLGIDIKKTQDPVEKETLKKDLK